MPISMPEQSDPWEAIILTDLTNKDLNCRVFEKPRLNALGIERFGTKILLKRTLRGDEGDNEILFFLNSGVLIVKGSNWADIQRDVHREIDASPFTLVKALTADNTTKHFEIGEDDSVRIPFALWMETTFRRPPKALHLDRLQFGDGKRRDRSWEYLRQASDLHRWMAAYQESIIESASDMPYAEEAFDRCMNGPTRISQEVLESIFSPNVLEHLNKEMVESARA